MRKLALITAAATFSVGIAVPALAAPSGSTESSGNQVTCDTHPRTPTGLTVVERNGGVVVQGNTGTVYAGERGAEVCGDNGGSYRGRTVATTDQGGYVAQDGAVVPGHAVTQDDGCYRVGASGAHVNPSGGDSDRKCV